MAWTDVPEGVRRLIHNFRMRRIRGVCLRVEIEDSNLTQCQCIGGVGFLYFGKVYYRNHFMFTRLRLSVNP